MPSQEDNNSLSPLSRERAEPSYYYVRGAPKVTVFTDNKNLSDSFKILWFLVLCIIVCCSFQINCGETSVNDNYRLAHYRFTFYNNILPAHTNKHTSRMKTYRHTFSHTNLKIYNLSYKHTIFLNHQFTYTRANIKTYKDRWQAFCSTAPVPEICSDVDPENKLCQGEDEDDDNHDNGLWLWLWSIDHDHH